MLDPAQIVQSAQMWVCDACGCQDNKSCSCNSSAHMEKLAARAEKKRVADRERIAAKRNVALRGVENIEDSRDDQSPWAAHGKPAPEPDDMPTAEEANESYQDTLYDHACLIVDERMSGETRQRFFAFLKRKYDAKYTQSASQSGDQGLPA